MIQILVTIDKKNQSPISVGYNRCLPPRSSSAGHFYFNFLRKRPLDIWVPKSRSKTHFNWKFLLNYYFQLSQIRRRSKRSERECCLNRDGHLTLFLVVKLFALYAKRIIPSGWIRDTMYGFWWAIILSLYHTIINLVDVRKFPDFFNDHS